MLFDLCIFRLSMSLPTNNESQTHPLNSNAPTQSIGSKRAFESQSQTPIEVQSNQTPSNRVDVEGVEGAQEETSKEDYKANLKSIYWQYFDRIKDIPSGKFKAVCKFCNKKLVGETNAGTTHLRKHYESCVLRKSQDIRQALLNPKRGSDGKTTLTNYTFDQQEARNALGKMIIKHEYPLQIVEHQGFREFCNKLQPLFKHVSRNTIKADIMKIYEHEKVKTTDLLSNNLSRFSVTTDMWTSSNKKRGFMAVTVHFVDNSWNLQSRIIR